MAAALLSDEEFGLAPPTPTPVSNSGVDMTKDPAGYVPTGHEGELTVRPPKPQLLSDEEFGIAPNGSGILSNADDDGYASGIAKGAATAAIKGLSNSVGTPGNLVGLSDMLMGHAESFLTGRPLDQVYAEQTAKRQAFQKDYDNSGLPFAAAVDPRNAPTGTDIAAPILKRTGEYVPSSDNYAGRLLQSGAEAAFGMVGPGAGGLSKGTSLLQGAVKTPLAMAPANIVGGAAGQLGADYTGDPLYGMAAGMGAAGAMGGPTR